MDGDGYSNFAEYVLGTDPRVAESGASVAVSSSQKGASTSISVSWTERTTSDYSARLESSADSGVTWQTVNGSIASSGSGPVNTASEMFAVPSVGAIQVRLVLRQASTKNDNVVPDIAVANGNSRLVNLSSRGMAGTGASQLIAGFVTAGGMKSLLIRAAGPGLAQFGVPNFITNPVLTLQAPGTGAVVAANDNWQDNGAGALVQKAENLVGAFPFGNGSLDAALVQSLAVGAYTASVTAGVGSSGSTALVEIYDADALNALGKLLDVSTRGSVGTGGGVMIAGFVVAGSQPKRVLVRAAGPALAGFGVGGTLSDPQITLYRSDGTAIASNDDWMIVRDPAVSKATAARLGAFSFAADSLDAALVITLPPGSYTAVVSGVNAATGNALVEVYDAD